MDISNENLFFALIEYTKFLRPFDLPHTDIKAFQHFFVDTEHLQKDGVHIGIQELSAMLLLLIGRKYLIPVSFKNPEILNFKGDGVPFFVLESDIKHLPEDCKFEYFDMNQASKTMFN